MTILAHLAENEHPYPDPGFPHFGRDAHDRAHAIYRIVELLTELGLAEWVPHFSAWLSRYDGLEIYAEDEDDPHLCVREILKNHCQNLAQESSQAVDLAGRKESIVQDILQQPFVHYRAHWGKNMLPDPDSIQWNPLQMSWFHFLQQGDPQHPTESLHILLTLRHPRPTLETLRAHLLER